MSNWLAHVKANGCGALPKDAERVLMDAARRARNVPSNAPIRHKIIDRAYDLTSRMYPTMFKD